MSYKVKQFPIFHRYLASILLRVKLAEGSLSQLLTACKKLYINRLFLWFAKRHDLQCIDSLNISDINLGKGKRMIVRGGSLDKEFQITVPKEMANDVRPDFF